MECFGSSGLRRLLIIMKTDFHNKGKRGLVTSEDRPNQPAQLTEDVSPIQIRVVKRNSGIARTSPARSGANERRYRHN